MSWIRKISFEESEGELRKIYERVKGPHGTIDNVVTVHSLRPHTLTGHMVLYKNVLHHSENTLPKWYMESLGVYVSLLNGCTYCATHHSEGLKRLTEKEKWTQILDALQNDAPGNYFSGRELEGMRYAKKLTQSPAQISEDDIQRLRKAGFSDGEILEVNQVISYFNYANRTVSRLGVNLHGDNLGLSPSDEDESWSHG